MIEKLEEIEKEIELLRKKLEKLEKEIPGISYGTVVEKYIRCGKSECKNCPHGPYYYLSFKQDGKTKTKYLRTDKKIKMLGNEAKIIKKRLRQLEKAKRKLLNALLST